MSATPRQLRIAYVLGLVLFLVGVFSVTSYALWRLRTDAIANALQVATLHSRSFENYLTQSLRVSELAADNVLSVASQGTQLSQIEPSFRDILRHSPFLRSLSLQDDAGRILASSNRANLGVVVPNDSYLPVTDQNQDVLRMGQPWAGRDFAGGRASTPLHPVVANEQSFIPITKTLQNGSHKLHLLIALNPDYFVNHIVDALDKEEGFVEIIRYDGIVLISSDPRISQGSLHDYVVRDLVLKDIDSGTFDEYNWHGRDLLTAYRASRLYPILVVTHLDREVALLPWRTEIKTLLAALVPLLLTALLLTSFFYRRQMETARQRDEAERLVRINATVFDASSEAIIITDAQANILSVNASFTSITGYTEQEVKGCNPRLLSSGQHDKTFFIAMWDTLKRSGKWRGELVNHRKDGSAFDAQMSISKSLSSDGRVQHFVGVMTDVTEIKRNETIRNELNRDFVSFLENTSDFVYFKDRSSRFRFASQTLASITNHASWRDMLGKHDLEVFPADTARIYFEEELPVFRDGTPLLGKVDPYYDAKGNRGWVSTNKWPLFDESGQVVGLFGMSRDITAFKQNEAKLELAASVFSNSREGIMITETDGTIVDVNEAFTLITGYSREEIVGQNPRILKSGRQSAAHYKSMWKDLVEQGHWYGEVWNRRKSGEVYAEIQTISTVRDAQGNAQHYVALFSDITVSKEHQLRLEHIAHYDTLTNLPNRVLLADRLAQAMAQSQRRATKLAVVYIDLDGFKGVNDTHGHEAGDQLLISLASEMKKTLREGDTLARIGGDEFVAVLVDLVDATESLPILRRLLDTAAAPTVLGDSIVHVSASLGLTVYPQDEEMDADQLQRQADQAMYQAKMAGKNRYHFFDAEHDRNVRGLHASLERIRLAIDAGEFVLHYQPKVNMRTGKIVGAEALIRWQHPEQGLLAPGLFLPVIEDHPLTVEVGEWVTRQALYQSQAWRALGLNLPVSINVSARQIQQRDFVARLQAILAEYPDVQPGSLELEILETSALEDVEVVSNVIKACRTLGVNFALDDFGTGYSSLTYLKRLPVTLIKIDQSFVSDMLDDQDNLLILQGVIDLAKTFHREVMAEGVETVAHGTALLQMGCELAQGYGIARPMPAHEMALWVNNWVVDSAWLEPRPVYANTP
jgi:diguanylate cyclase (GGDEF)-like protein/PAS domain S-box-containing protein